MNDEELYKSMASITQARINLGNSGSGIPTKHLLKLKLDHALAKDAIYTKLNSNLLQSNLKDIGINSILVKTRAVDRDTFLKHPDSGRKLDNISRDILTNSDKENDIDIIFIIADGLSANAIQKHAFLFISYILPGLKKNYAIDEIVIVEQGRVAISDEICELRKAKLSIILIGERPGLSSPDSMGIYLTYNPKVGNTDEKRNCISNIRMLGLTYEMAAIKLNYLINESLKRKLSGINLKEESLNNNLT